MALHRQNLKDWHLSLKSWIISQKSHYLNEFMLQSRFVLGTRWFCFRVNYVVQLDEGYSFIKPGKSCQTHAENNWKKNSKTIDQQAKMDSCRKITWPESYNNLCPVVTVKSVTPSKVKDVNEVGRHRNRERYKWHLLHAWTNSLKLTGSLSHTTVVVVSRLYNPVVGFRRLLIRGFLVLFVK